MKVLSPLLVVLQISVAVLSASTAAAQDLTLPMVLSRMDEKAKVFKSLNTGIKSVHTEFGRPQPAESGKLLMAMTPGKTDSLKIYWEVTEPKILRKTILVQNGKGTYYNESQNTYMTHNVDSNSDVLQLLLLGFGVPSAEFSKLYRPTLKGRSNDVKGVELELTSISPKTEEFPKVTLWLDEKSWTPVQIRLGGKRSNSFTDYIYSGAVLNSNLGDSKFQQKIPRGARKQE